MRTKIVWVLLCLFQTTNLAYSEEDCPAPKNWFGTAGTPAPSNDEPRRGDDCAFYQRAWQTFLYVTDRVNGLPRLLQYKTYADVFGSDPKAGLVKSQNKLIPLAPRLIKSPQTTDAEDVEQAGSSAILIDQNGHPIFYNIIMNPTFVKFVANNGFTDVNKLINAKPTLEMPVGAVEFKAAWQIVDKTDPPKDRIIAEAGVPWLIDAGGGKLKVDPSRPLRAVTVALLGLHVVMRPKGHPEMIWATFEHDRNAPSTAGNPLENASNCLNPGEVRDETVKDDGSPYILYATGTLTKDANKKPSSITILDPNRQTFDPKTSIVRVFPFSSCSPARDVRRAVKELDPAIVTLNKNVKIQIHGENRKGYSLIGAVWMDEPRNPNEDRRFKEDRTFEDFELGGENRLSSTSMESFTQISFLNCFACHDTTEKGNLGPKRISVSHIFRRFSIERSLIHPH